MREYKIRVWSYFNNRIGYIMSYYNLKDSDIMYNFYFKEDCKMTQYTGHKDVNGKEIYEGDIVKFHTFKDRFNGKVGIVKYGIYDFSHCDEYDCSHEGYYVDYNHNNYCENTGFPLYYNWIKYEVIGNIFQNPDLINNIRR